MRFKMGLIFCFVLAMSACQTENSSTLDAANYGGVSGTSSAVVAIFSQHCTPCHQFQAMSANDLVATGYMIKGDPDNSVLYNSLKGSSSPSGSKDMPQGASPLAASDLSIIRDFILNAN